MDTVHSHSSYMSNASSPRAEQNHLKAVIAAKDACLFNFSKTLRMADERAKLTEASLHRRIQELEFELSKRSPGGHKQAQNTPDQLTAELIRLQKELAADRDDLNALRAVHEENVKMSTLKEANFQKLIQKLESEVQHAIQQQKAAEQGLKMKTQDFQDRTAVLENELFQIRNKTVQEVEALKLRLVQCQQDKLVLKGMSDSRIDRVEHESLVEELKSELVLANSRRTRAEELQKQAEVKVDAILKAVEELRFENSRLMNANQHLETSLQQAEIRTSQCDAVEIENQELRTTSFALQERVRGLEGSLENLGNKEEYVRREAMERAEFLERNLRSTQEELQVLCERRNEVHDFESKTKEHKLKVQQQEFSVMQARMEAEIRDLMAKLAGKEQELLRANNARRAESDVERGNNHSGYEALSLSSASHEHSFVQENGSSARHWSERERSTLANTPARIMGTHDRFIRIGKIDVQDGTLQDIQSALKLSGDECVDVILRRANGQEYTLKARRRIDGDVGLSFSSPTAPFSGDSLMTMRDPDKNRSPERSSLASTVRKKEGSPLYSKTAQMFEDLERYSSSQRRDANLTGMPNGTAKALSTQNGMDASPLYGKTAQMIEELESVQKLRNSRSSLAL